MAVILEYKDYTIKVFDDAAFDDTPGSPTTYDKVYQPDKDKEYKPISKHAIVIYRNDIIVASAMLLAVAGATSVTSDAVLIDHDNLITRCCNTVFSLTLPELELNWMTEVDWATCFSIHKYNDTFITHGEMSVARIDRNGNKLWSYTGADIFVCLDEGNAFEMHDNFIELMDFNGSSYKIDYDGKTIDYNESDYYKQKPATIYLKKQKPWWKFW